MENYPRQRVRWGISYIGIWGEYPMCLLRHSVEISNKGECGCVIYRPSGIAPAFLLRGPMNSGLKSESTDRRRPMSLASLLLCAALATGQVARADSQHDFLAFLSVSGMQMSDASDPALEGSSYHATADFLYTFNSDNFRFLAEYIWSNTESEMERLKGAWVIDDETILWFGRFHTITNFWTSEFHHGQYLQTSISRPGLEEWEDESGPMPSHITGAWFEHRFELKDQSSIDFALTAGLAPIFEGELLHAFDILDPTSGHDTAVSTRLAYRPDVLSTNQVGLTISRNDIAVVSESNPDLTDLNSIRQVTYGLFAGWQWHSWKFLTNLVYFDIEMDYTTGEVPDDFFLGYLQGEYQATPNWTIFGRTEFGDGEDDSPYLSLLPAVVAHRQMLGVRWDFADSHALTMEVAETSRQGADPGHDHFKEFRLQWSAVFP